MRTVPSVLQEGCHMSYVPMRNLIQAGLEFFVGVKTVGIGEVVGDLRVGTGLTWVASERLGGM